MMRNSISCIVLGTLMSLASAQAEVGKFSMPSFDVSVEKTDVASADAQRDDQMSTVAAQLTHADQQDASLFKGYDQQAIAAEPAETTSEGHSNIITRLDEIKEQNSNQAVRSSRAVQRAASYKVRGKRYTTLADSDGFVQTGRASWYGKRFHGRKTASGEPFDMNALTAAHKELPLGTKIEVTNNANGKSIVVTVNDRGPFHGNRVLDLSKEAARQLGLIRKGTANVTIRAL